MEKAESSSVSKQVLTCEFCSKTFLHKGSVQRHIRLQHKEHDSGAKRSARIICPYSECSNNFHNYFALGLHLKNEHTFEVECEDLTFNSLEAFELWKTQTEQSTLASFIKDCASKTLATGDEKVYFHCHRSYNYTKKGANIRAPKSIGSNKIGKACPARMEVTFEKSNKKVLVKFWKSHCGHEAEIGRIHLSKETRLKIAEKLKEGVAFEKILDSVRDSGLSDDNSKRLLLLERKDMWNILNEFNINYSTKRHQNDAVSVRLWVNEMMKMGEESPVLFYKGQNEDGRPLKKQDFGLILMTSFQSDQLKQFGGDKICIDGTHGTNAYDFQLYTMLTVDEFGSGCPVAFCISNRSDENIFKLFFEVVKSKVGNITPKTFMSDDAPAFYNAWIKVMDGVPTKLLCTWHVDRNWRQNLSKVSGSVEKKALVYNALRVLLQTTSKEDFNVLLPKIQQDLLNDKDTQAFGEYFQKYYVPRTESWAYCHRTGLGINTNMYLESFHKILKHIYLNGKKVKRLDKTIDALIKVARDSFFKRLIKLGKKAPTGKIQAIKKSHLSSQIIEVESIEVIDPDKEWKIASNSNPAHSYFIRKEIETCTQICLSCEQCNICIHSYECTCSDYLLNVNICTHIHACVRFFGSDKSPSAINKKMSDEIEKLFEKQNVVPDSSVKNNNVLIGLSQMITDFCSTVSLSDEAKNAAEKHLRKVIDIFNESKIINLDTTVEINTRQNVEKQPRPSTSKGLKEAFFSTKKKQEHKADITVPSENEKNAILQGLLSNNSEIVHIHSSCDHAYTKVLSNQTDVEVKKIKELSELTKILSAKRKTPPSETEILSLTHLSTEYILQTFEGLRPVLDSIFKSLSKAKNIKGFKGITHMNTIMLIDDEKQLKMMKFLRENYQPEEKGVPSLTDLYINVLLPEWTVNIFMKEFNFTRSEAIQRLQTQEEYTVHQISKLQSTSS